MYKQTSLRLIKDQSNSQNTLLRLQKPHYQAQNHIFISKQQRFNNKPNDSHPGPGSYIDPLARSRQLQSKSQKQKSSTKASTKNHLDNFVSREHQWIFGSDRISYLNQGSGLAPGAYNVVLENLKKAQDSWSKSSRFNGTQWSQSQNSLGPGSYNARVTNIKPRKKEMSVFKSKSPKTFLEQLEKSIQKSQQKIQNDKKIEPFNHQVEQLQRLANTQEKQKKKNKMDSIFLSKSKRYQFANPENGIAGPGSYNLQNNSLIKRKRNKNHSVSTSTNFIREKSQEIQQIYPGPTSYNVEKYNMQKQVSKKISSLKGNMALQTRFKSIWKQAGEGTTIPGPGHYNRQKYIYVDQKQYQHKPLVNHHQKIEVPFLSSSSRVVQPSKVSPFGGYNLNQYDLAQKAKKKRSHIQKLKAMDISVPGFQSSERRTTFNLGKIMKDHFHKLQNPHASIDRVKSNSSLHKQNN